MTTTFAKKFLYTLNILVFFCIILLVIFSINSIAANYKSLILTSYKIESEYNQVLHKYKKVAEFILKNGLPENINYFNSFGMAAYDLLPIKAFSIGGSRSNNNNEIMGCNENKCIKIVLDKKELLSKVAAKIGRYNLVSTMPVKKLMLAKMAVSTFLSIHKNNFIVIFLSFFVLYLCQSLFLFRKNLKLARVYTSLLNKSNKNKSKLIKQLSEHDALCDGVLFAQEITGEYFAHYVHQLLTRDIYSEDVNLPDIFFKIKKFLCYQITRSNLAFILECDGSIKVIESDREIVFIVLLNLMFKAVFRAKAASTIVVKIFPNRDSINIEINDVGYEYNAKLSDKIQIYALSAPVLEKLCKKIGIIIDEIRKDDFNIIYVKVAPSVTIEEITKNHGGIIRINLYEK